MRPRTKPPANPTTELNTTACHRSLVRIVTIWGAFFFFGCVGPESNPVEEGLRPNILFIMSDAHATQAVSAYGSPLIQTPNIDRIAEEGIRFDRVYCTNAICAPSRASILSGLLSHHHGVVDNVAPLDRNTPTFPQIFQQNGYQTGLFGKWHLKSEPIGFDRWAVLPGQGHYYNPDIVEGGERRREEGHSTELITNLALDWLTELKNDQPFLMMLQYKAPHRNWMPAPEFLEKYRGETLPIPSTLFDDYSTRSEAARQQEMTIDRHLHQFYDLKHPEGMANDGLSAAMNRILNRMTPQQRALWQGAYAAENQRFEEEPPVGDDLLRWKYQRYIQDYLRCVAGVDHQIGRVLSALEARGELDNTIVVYTSDQGFYLGEHGWYDKRFLYEESSRMPLVMRYPNTIPSGITSSALLENVDLAPTLLEAAMLPPLQGIDGQSFWKQATREPNATHRNAVYAHYFEYPGVHAVKRHYGIRTEKYKLIHFYYDIDEWELYDLEEDPHELNNLIDQPQIQSVRRQLTSMIRERQRECGDDPQNFKEGLTPETVEHDAIGQSVQYINPPTRDYGQSEELILTDGLIRSNSRYAPRIRSGWLAWRRHDAEFILDWRKPRTLREVALHVLREPASWIHLPSEVVFSSSTDGENYSEFARVSPNPSKTGGTIGWITAPTTPSGPIRAIKVVAKRLNEIPAGMPGQGERSWIFIDEILVRE